MINSIIHGDCLEVMKSIPDGSVDMILADLPYGITANKWDAIIPFDQLWLAYHRIVKANGAIALTATEPFSSMLVMSNMKRYRHKWVWNKNNSAGFVNAKRQPFQITEDVLVFGVKGVKYYPIMEERGKPRKKGGYSSSTNYFIKPDVSTNNLYYPKNVLIFPNAGHANRLHPTQKPLALCEYLIRTYTREGELVLDNTCGSGTTCLAAKNTNRNFIGIEMDDRYFEIATNRLNG